MAVGTQKSSNEILCWDIGLEETRLCVVDSEGQTVREVKISTEPVAIRSALEGYADRLDRVGVEASSLGIWLYRELQPAGVPIIVVEARRTRVSLSTMRNPPGPASCGRHARGPSCVRRVN